MHSSQWNSDLICCMLQFILEIRCTEKVHFTSLLKKRSCISRCTVFKLTDLFSFLLCEHVTFPPNIFAFIFQKIEEGQAGQNYTKYAMFADIEYCNDDNFIFMFYQHADLNVF